MKIIRKRDRQTVRFLNWVRRYPGWWHLICTPNDGNMNIKTMNKLVRCLAQEQLYEIIFVLLTVHRKEEYVKDLSGFMLLNLMAENWSGKSKNGKQVIKSIQSYLE